MPIRKNKFVWSENLPMWYVECFDKGTWGLFSDLNFMIGSLKIRLGNLYVFN